jgi:hypothetical protein
MFKGEEAEANRKIVKFHPKNVHTLVGALDDVRAGGPIVVRAGHQHLLLLVVLHHEAVVVHYQVNCCCLTLLKLPTLYSSSSLLCLRYCAAVSVQQPTLLLFPFTLMLDVNSSCFFLLSLMELLLININLTLSVRRNILLARQPVFLYLLFCSFHGNSHRHHCLFIMMLLVNSKYNTFSLQQFSHKPFTQMSNQQLS